MERLHKLYSSVEINSYVRLTQVTSRTNSSAKIVVIGLDWQFLYRVDISTRRKIVHIVWSRLASSSIDKIQDATDNNWSFLFKKMSFLVSKLIFFSRRYKAIFRLMKSVIRPNFLLPNRHQLCLVLYADILRIGSFRGMWGNTLEGNNRFPDFFFTAVFWKLTRQEVS